MDPIKIEEKYALPEGNYVVVTWDLVITGGNLSDEICQIAAHAPGTEMFSQYVMPYRNMSIGARRRHGLNVVTTGRYRILKDLRSHKILRTKSEFSALGEFMDWLAEVKGSTDGIILVAHDNRKLLNSVMMEALQRYKLRDQFCSLVKGFANCFTIAETKCAKTVRTFSIRTLAHVLLSSEENLSEATERAHMTYKLLEQMLEGSEGEGVSDEEAEKKSPMQLAKDLLEFCWSIEGQDKMTAELKALQERETSLNPLFAAMRNTRSDRQRSYTLQHLLAQANIDYDTLSNIYQKGGSDAVNEVLKYTVAQQQARELEELKHLVALHFNPEYKGEWKPEKLETEKKTMRAPRRNSRARKTHKGNVDSKVPSSPESEDNKSLSSKSTAKNTPANSPKEGLAMPTVVITSEESASRSIVVSTM